MGAEQSLTHILESVARAWLKDVRGPKSPDPVATSAAMFLEAAKAAVSNVQDHPTQVTPRASTQPQEFTGRPEREPYDNAANNITQMRSSAERKAHASDSLKQARMQLSDAAQRVPVTQDLVEDAEAMGYDWKPDNPEG